MAPYRLISADIRLLSFALAGTAQATLTFDEDVAPDITFGNANRDGEVAGSVVEFGDLIDDNNVLQNS